MSEAFCEQGICLYVLFVLSFPCWDDGGLLFFFQRREVSVLKEIFQHPTHSREVWGLLSFFFFILLMILNLALGNM